MSVENLVMFAGATFILTYKPDIFSALGIYRTNKQDSDLYSSHLMLMKGSSRVETVGTGN
jgi:hypothetical protein